VSRAFVALLGGTFDPLHCGHLEGARDVLARSGCDRVLLLPSAAPPHREPPEASAADRLEMVRRAVAGVPGLEADGRELMRDGPSYSVDTLLSIRAELGHEAALGMVIGADALARLDSWDRWRELTALAHLLVLDRPGAEPPRAGPVAAHLAGRETSDPKSLRAAPAGAVWWVHQRPWAVSASEIRHRLHAGEPVNGLIPRAVSQYIRERGLYAGVAP